MPDPLYINNFKGRAGRLERAKHIVDEFAAIEDAFTKLQALNIATYLTTYVNTQTLTGSITIRPDNGFLQELTITEDTYIAMAAPLNESQYRVSLLIHGGGYKIFNGWGAQTWKEYGNEGDWWTLHTGEGPYASMLLDFFWDICSNTWICVASSKNQFNTLEAGTEQRFYPLLCDLSNTTGDDTLGFTRASEGQTIDHNQAYHYLPSDEPRFHGVRYEENWCPTASDLTSLAWVATNCTVTTDLGLGPGGTDVQRLVFTATGGKVASYLLPSFGRSSTAADSIKIAVSFKGRAVTGTADVRLVASFCGKTNLDPPVHDRVQIAMDSTWQTYGAVLDITKEGNANYPLTLDAETPKTLTEIAFVSPSGSLGSAIHITDVFIKVLRGTDEETVSVVEESTIGASLVLSGTGTGSWVDGTKTLTLASGGQSIDFGANLESGKTYLVHPRLQNGVACDIRMQNDVTVWAAGDVSDETYVQDAPFSFQYDGGVLKFVLAEGGSSVYLVDIYEVSNNRGVYCYQNEYVVDGEGGVFQAIADPPIPVSSGILDGVAREITSTNQIPYVFFRTFNAWDQSGLTGVDAAACRNPVYQSEYGIDGWPSRATLLQGASRVTDGFIQRVFTIPASTGGQDFTMWIRRSIDPEGNEVYTPQFNDVNVPISRYVDFEAELLGGTSTIESGRVRLDIQNASFVGASLSPNYRLGVFKWADWYHITISLTNDGTHNQFRVRVYPASADVADPSVIDVTTQGWVVIDWAQFEDKTGTFYGSSPIIGGETRATEDYTSALADGHFYETEISMSQTPDGHVATLTSNNLIWDQDDGIYKNLIYSTTTMIAVQDVLNMHEFGLVEIPGEPPPPPPEPPDDFQNYEAILLLASPNYTLYLLGVNYQTGAVTELSSAWAGDEDAIAASVDEQFVFRMKGFSTWQYIWRGNCFSVAYFEDYGGNSAADLRTLKGLDNNFITVGQEAFGHGLRVMTYETSAPFDFALNYTRQPANDYWDGMFELRYGNNGLAERGDALVCQPQNGNAITTYENVAGSLTLRDQLTALSLGNKAAWGSDPDSGVMTSNFTAEMYFRAYKIDMSDLSITYTGQLSPTVNQVYASSPVPDYPDIFITFENTGLTQDYVRTYQHDGIGGLTMLDEFLLESNPNSNFYFHISPYTKRIWLVGPSAALGQCAFRVDESGTIFRDIRIAGYTVNTSGFNGSAIAFIKDPTGMIITPNGYTGIKAKLYQSWEMDETGSVTRVGSMTNYYAADLPVYIGTVTDRAGALTKAADFPGDASPGLLQLTLGAQHTELRTQGTFTMTIEVEVDDLTEPQAIICRARNDFQETVLEQLDFLLQAEPQSDRFLWQIRVNATAYNCYAYVSGGMASATKYMLRVAYNKQTQISSIQLNDDAVGSVALPANSNINVYPAAARFTLGRRTGFGSLQSDKRVFDGGMRRLRMFWDELTTDEIAWLYNNGAGRDFSEF